ncbi:MAG: hypothetical protein HC788_13140 [Sphingopyxis sp.]|nr:hypothetical protein [Sphingopyxis sp.]
MAKGGRGEHPDRIADRHHQRLFAAAVDDAGLAYVHVFPFSPREGTPAARMPQLSPVLARDRAAALRSAVARQHDRLRADMLGTPQRMLVENDGLSGHAENFARLLLDKAAAPGSLCGVTVTDIQGAARAHAFEVA